MSCRKAIPLIVLEEGSYEKDVLMYINLGVPQMVGGMCLVQISCSTYAFGYSWFVFVNRAISLEFIVLGRNRVEVEEGEKEKVRDSEEWVDVITEWLNKWPLH